MWIVDNQHGTWHACLRHPVTEPETVAHTELSYGVGLRWRIWAWGEVMRYVSCYQFAETFPGQNATVDGARKCKHFATVRKEPIEQG